MNHIKFVRTHLDAKVPAYATVGSAGMDLVSVEDVELQDGTPVAVDTGLRIQLPEGFEAQVRPRSGLSLKGIGVANSPGTIDSDYRGQLKVILIYRRVAACSTFKINKGDRIAQLVITRVDQLPLVEVVSLDDTDRGEGGFGSTGLKS